MADDITLNAGSGGSTLATDQAAGGEHYQQVKLVDGTADSTTVIASGNGVATGALRVTLASDSTGQTKLAAGSATIGTVNIGTVSTGATALGKAVDSAAGASDVGVALLVVRDDSLTTLSPADGDYTQLRVTSTGRLWTSAAAAGDVASDAADSGNPVKIGGKAKETDKSDPGSVAEDDRVDAIFDLNGRQLVNTAHPNLWHATDNVGSAQTNKVLKAAPGSNLHLYVTDIMISADGNDTVKLVEDTGGTPVDVYEVVYLAGNSQHITNLRTPIRLSENKDLGYTSTTAVNLSVTICGYIAP